MIMFPAQFLDLISAYGACGVASQTLLSGFHEVLRALEVDALRYALAAAQFSNAVFTTQAVNPILIFGPVSFFVPPQVLV